MNLPASTFIGTTSYNWLYAEVNDATGIAGQGNANPASFFNNHQVVYVNSQYYDPSYGIKHPSLQDIEDTSIDGFYLINYSYPVNEPLVNLDLNGNGYKTDSGVDTVVILFQKNTSGLNISIDSQTTY